MDTVISMKLLYTCQIFVIGPVWDGIEEYTNVYTRIFYLKFLVIGTKITFTD